MKLLFTSLSICILFSSVSFAQVRVAFLEAQLLGKKLILEPQGTYYHLAIQIEDGRWLHSHPVLGGTRLTLGLPPKFGLVTQVLEDYNRPLIKLSDIESCLGLAFDGSYSFKSRVSSYCSKLVGQILNIPPKPKMSFSGKVWENNYKVKKNQPGWSPDYVFQYLLNEEGFKPLIPFVTRMVVNVSRLPQPVNPDLIIRSQSVCMDVLK